MLTTLLDADSDPQWRLHQQIRLRDGSAVGFAEYGDPAGEPVVFFHGWPGCRLQAAPAAEMALRLNLRVLALERPGLGLSSRRSDWRLADWPVLLEEALEVLGVEDFSVFAVSGGAPYGCITAWAMGDRVRRCAICCGKPPLTEFPDWNGLLWVFRLLRPVRERAPWLMPALLEFARNFCLYSPGTSGLRTIARLAPTVDRAAILRGRNAGLVNATLREVFGQDATGLLADVEVLLRPWGFPWRDIRVPLRFWHGDRDITLPLDKTKWMAAQIPGATFTTVPNEGHYSLPLNRSEEMLGWLAGR